MCNQTQSMYNQAQSMYKQAQPTYNRSQFQDLTLRSSNVSDSWLAVILVTLTNKRKTNWV
jgi:hypothetical protein